MWLRRTEVYQRQFCGVSLYEKRTRRVGEKTLSSVKKVVKKAVKKYGLFYYRKKKVMNRLVDDTTNATKKTTI